MRPGNRNSELLNSLKSFICQSTSALKVGLEEVVYSFLRVNIFQNFHGNSIN
jgi:hypothetical protein